MNSTPRELIVHVCSQEELPAGAAKSGRFDAEAVGAFPAFAYFYFAYDEHWHHRGQPYTYLRLLGKVPPDLYDYGAAV
jgi:hypothetical protein